MNSSKIESDPVEKLTELYERWNGTKAKTIEKLPQSGSNRSYYRYTDFNGQSVIGVIGTSCEECHAFIYLTRHFTDLHLPVPKILAQSTDELRYLQTDLGSRSLFDALSSGRNSGGMYNFEERELLSKVIRQLPQLQVCGATGLDFSHCYPQAEFDIDGVMFDLNYFKYCFLKATGIEFHEVRLEAEFRLFAKDLTAEPSHCFLHRDFQSRNIMLDEHNAPWFIDYQGGRRGPFYYDLASFLWQASARYSHRLRRHLVAEYYDSLKHYSEVPSVRHFADRLSLFVLFRTLQVLGAYGFRGYFEHKQHFIDSIPPAIQNLREILQRDCFPYPYMSTILLQICDMPRYEQSPQQITHDITQPPYQRQRDLPNEKAVVPPLTVEVYSFSYRKGIPADESGNGGGYVFDCRSTHNPGRYEPYKHLTGLDEPVIRFLEHDGEIITFLHTIYLLADFHVARYLQRGFTHLMFSFGCTGGRHRSVYCAQHLGEHIHDKFGIEVHIIHKEQDTRTLLNAKR